MFSINIFSEGAFVIVLFISIFQSENVLQLCYVFVNINIVLHYSHCSMSQSCVLSVNI